MSKKNKIILSIIIILIIVLIVCFYYWKAISYEYVCIIEKIENDELVVKEFTTKTQEFLDKYNITLQKYRFSIKNAIIIKDSKGKKINATNLKIGDKIRIINIHKIQYNVPGIYREVKKLKNVILIQVLDN